MTTVKSCLVPATGWLRARYYLKKAQRLYDDPAIPFAHSAKHGGWQRGFRSGADWMRLVMARQRGISIPASPHRYQLWGLIKYGSCCLGAGCVAAVLIALQWWLLVPAAIFSFYLIEVQLVFLFPLLIDGSAHPCRESQMLLRRAGGTIAGLKMVLPLAAVMLFGGFFKQGFIRSWALGCLTVVLWYEDVRLAS